MESQEKRDGELSPFEAAKARIGTMLNAKWRLDSLLGVGGMGSVFAATHRNGSRAAVKVLHVEFARDEDIRDRFLREGKIANRVDHPARVAVTDDDTSDNGEPFLVMELLEGSTLERVLKRAGGTLPLDEALRVFDPVLDLLAKCHAVHVVHRDIKPANIFVTKSGEVKVLDFGVARMRDPGQEATRAGTALGTPSFMAPEQALGLDAADGRADLFSVGACLFTALTNQRLHRGQNETESFILAATQAAPSIATVAELPVEIVALVDKALAFDRARRFQDAKTMRTELIAIRQAIATGSLTSAKKASGLVVKGNEVIEGDAQETEESRAFAFERMAAVWKNLTHALMGVRQYGWNHPTTAKSLQMGFDELSKLLVQNPTGARWDVTAQSFSLDDKPIFVGDKPPFDRMPFQLFRDGIRRVQLKPGIELEELRDFLAILTRDTSAGVGAEDDSVTALWDRRFDHIAYLAIDSFAEGDANERETFQKEVAEIANMALSHSLPESELGDETLEGKALERNLQGLLKDVGEAAAALAVDPLTKATLGAQVTLSAEKWRERFLDGFVEGYVDANRRGDVESLTSALQEWTRDQVSLHNHGPAFEMEQSLLAAFEARLGAEPVKNLERDMMAVMFPPDTLSAILAEVIRAGRDVEQSLSLPPAMMTGIARALEIYDDDSLMGTVCECYEVSRLEALRTACSGYIRRFAKGHEADLALTLPRATQPLALELVALLGSLRTPASLRALEAAFKSPHTRVRVEALTHMPDAPAEMVKTELGRLLEDPSPAVRMEALRMVAKLNVVAAGPILTRTTQAEAFHELPQDERKAWFEALFKLNAVRAEGIAVEMLNKKQIIPSEAIEATREVAARMLAGCTSSDALEALRNASKRRWWNTQPVRDAATESLAAAEAKLLGRPNVGEKRT
jgi:hypothetical protein